MVHVLRHCIKQHWTAEDFTVLKIDVYNAFYLVSGQALLDECTTHFPEPWASWCYGQKTALLQHTLGTITSDVGVNKVVH